VQSTIQKFYLFSKNAIGIAGKKQAAQQNRQFYDPVQEQKDVR